MEATAAVLNELGADLSLERVQLDDPRPDEVLVGIAAVGICHTDLASRNAQDQLRRQPQEHAGQAHQGLTTPGPSASTRASLNQSGG